MKLHRFVRFWWPIGTAIVVFGGPVAGVAAAPVPSNGLVVDQTPNPGYYGNILRDVAAPGAGDVWAVGVKATTTSNDTLAVHWNGTSWVPVSTPNPAQECQDGDILWAGQSLNGVAGVSSNDVWAVGGGCYGIDPLIEHWNGTAWSIVASPPLRIDGGDAWGTLSDVAAISSTNVWCVGTQSAGDYEGLVEHWGGSNWTVASDASPAGSYLTSVSATGPSDVWAVGGTDPNHNFVEHWNGASWSVVASPQPARGAASIRFVRSRPRTPGRLDRRPPRQALK